MLYFVYHVVVLECIQSFTRFSRSVVKEQIKLRENALQQSDLLMEYKRAFCHKEGLLGIFVSLLAEPLSKTGTARTELDHLTIELVLHLFRNLLSAQPLLTGMNVSSCIILVVQAYQSNVIYTLVAFLGSADTLQKSIHLHNELICLFEKELVLEILYVISQEMEARENAQYNLLMMELLNHLLRNQDPTLVARSSLAKQNRAPPAAVKTTAKAASRPTAKAIAPPKPGSLSAQLKRERAKLRPPTTSRHSHFGGTLVVNRLDGKRQYMSAALVEKGTTHPSAQKRKNKKTDPFIGSGRTLASHSKLPAAENTAQKTLHTFCERFIKDCYGPLMKSLKNEFRRDSQRLEEGDKVVFFKIIWFFSQWWRVVGKKSLPLGQLIFTMDVFTFNLVLNATDTFQQHKKYTQLAQAVSLYSEMMQLLFVMYHSKDSTENLMALGLLDRLFYGSDPLDRLPKLLSKWTAGTLTREFACDLVELVHVTLKLLEANSSTTAVNVDKKAAKSDAVARMKQTAAEFDLTAYVIRKIVSNQLVFMYTHVLAQYQINAPHVNHHVVALFMRLMKMHVAYPDDDEERGETPKNPIAVKPSTLEPMLYNIQLFIVVDQVLNDETIRNEKEYATLLSFATSLMSRFAAHSQNNPLAFVECLFRHPVPHRFCELTTNLYVNEELRMIAERELLLEEHRRLAEAEGEEEDDADATLFRRHSGRNSARSGQQATPTQPDQDDDDEEVEWDDSDKVTGKAPSASTKSDSSDTSDEDKDDDERKAHSEVDKDGGKEEDLPSSKHDGTDEEKDKDASTVEKDLGDFDSAKEVDDAANEIYKDDSMSVEKEGDESKNSNTSPKRKLLSDIDGNAAKASPAKRARIQRKSFETNESSDEELDFETQPPPGAVNYGSSRLVIGDDDEK